MNIDTYKQLLLKSGFAEATQREFHFWRVLTDKTAFIVNLTMLPNGVGVVYGVMSTAVFWTDGDWDYFKQVGCSDYACNLRFYVEIHSEDEQIEATSKIQNLYEEYLHIDKDTLLSAVKERRKQFIQQITNVLKPLGFRKNGNQWRKPLSDWHTGSPDTSAWRSRTYSFSTRRNRHESKPQNDHLYFLYSHRHRAVGTVLRRHSG